MSLPWLPSSALSHARPVYCALVLVAKKASNTVKVDHPGSWTDVQWRAALAPHRSRILVLMDGLGECTVQELAAMMGRSASSLYRHFEALQAAGFLESAREPWGGRTQTVYRRGWAMRVPPIDPNDGRGFARLGEFARLMLHEAGCQLERFTALHDGRRMGGGPESRWMVHTDLTWLDRERQVKVHELLEQALKVAREGRGSRAGVRSQLVLCCFPDVALSELRAGKRRSARRGKSA